MRSMFKPEAAGKQVRPPGERHVQPKQQTAGAQPHKAVGLRRKCIVAAVTLGFVAAAVLLIVAQQAFASKERAAESQASTTGSSAGVIASPIVAEIESEEDLQEEVVLNLSEDLAIDQGSLLTMLPWGEGTGQVGRSDPQEGLARGPEALAVTRDGRIVILDSVNRRVVVLDKDGKWNSAFALGLVESRFLAADERRIAVADVDVDRACELYAWSGALIKRMQIPALEQPATGLFLVAGRVWLESGHKQSVNLGEVPGGARGDAVSSGRPVPAPGGFSWARATLDRTRDWTIETPTARLSLPGKTEVDHLVSLDVDENGAAFVGARLTSGTILLARVQRREGSFSISKLALPEPSGLYVGAPYIVGADGRVFRPAATDAGYAIFVHEFDSVAQSSGEGVAR